METTWHFPGLFNVVEPESGMDAIVGMAENIQLPHGHRALDCLADGANS